MNNPGFQLQYSTLTLSHTHSLLLGRVTRWGRWETLFPIHQLAVGFPQGSLQLVDARLVLQQHVFWFIQKLQSEKDETRGFSLLHRSQCESGFSRSTIDKNCQSLKRKKRSRCPQMTKINYTVIFFYLIHSLC